jgi:hypothetical protein
VIDRSAEAAANPDYLLTIDAIRAFEAEHGPLPTGGWLLYRTGWDARAQHQEAFQRQRERPTHAGPGARNRPLASRGNVDPGPRRRNGRHRRRHCPLLRPALPLPLPPTRSRQVRPDPARQPRPPPHHRQPRHRRPPQNHRRHRQPGSSPGAGAARIARSIFPAYNPA